MRIGILVSSFYSGYIGGTETQTWKLADELSHKNDVIVIARDEGRWAKPGPFKLERFRYTKLPFISFFSHVKNSLGLIKTMQRKIDILQCMQLTPNGYVGIKARKNFGIPTVAWVRGGDWYFAKRTRFGRKIISKVINDSNAIFTQTKITRDEILNEYPDARIEVMPNGIDVNSNYMASDPSKNIVYAGSFIKRKGIEYLLRAMKNLYGYKLTLIGDGPEKDNMESLANKLGINTEFLGAVPYNRVRKYMSKSSLLVLPAIDGEGLPNVILEAMSIGLPVVATSLAGIPNVVSDNQTGIIVKPRDSQVMAHAIKTIIETPGLWRHMSLNSLNEIRKYSWPVVTKKLESQYQKIINL